ncbi:NADP-dependent oxidoreductase [Nonomuraea turkmeniaca]|uniref:NADP-dependent oxidoreductase n=1 Tax=Nonomuraea turkmeniaca TaxID=103838 RepID=A0A5S4FLJ8_9ACTN|nr:NADP-dependent oxidoreductase [Nonomuraea turkmeniaca]TMR21515.1 NADP-dependent oxidoreductase [Nonomuraea turkmeniaca]
MSNELISREIRLAARPVGEPGPGTFELAETRVPQPAEGQIVVRNTWMSVDPYMREWMKEEVSYAQPYEIGAPLVGSALGEVVASRAESVPVGSVVTHFLGWREYALLDAADATVVDTTLAPAEAYLGPLGTTGLTAYATLTRVAPVRPGDVVWVSAAAGAVGSIAGQVARKLGAARVIGSAGGPDKVKRIVTGFGFDTGLDHKAGPIAAQLAEAAPDGIDVYVDNVGGDHLRAAIAELRLHGRIGMVGAISSYNATQPVPGPDNLFELAAKNATLRGMLINHHFDLFPEWIERGSAWIADGSLHYEQTVLDGIERAPEAFLGVLRGANTGKMLVRLS